MVLLSSLSLSTLLLTTLIQALTNTQLDYCSHFLVSSTSNLGSHWFLLYDWISLIHLAYYCQLIFLKGNAYIISFPTLPKELFKHITGHHSWYGGPCLLLWPHLPLSLPLLSHILYIPVMQTSFHFHNEHFHPMLTLPNLLECPSFRHVHLSVSCTWTGGHHCSWLSLSSCSSLTPF